MASSNSPHSVFVPDIFRADFINRLRQQSDPAAWIGLSAVTWAQSFESGLAKDLARPGYEELNRRLNRDELQVFCARRDVPLRFRVAAVMAWGRSNPRSPRNNRNLWASIPNFEPLLTRFPQLSRKQLFTEFRHLVATGSVRGMRASFFTKLMFFFGCSGAYILDQWMAKNVLALLATNWHSGTGTTLTFTLARDNFIRLGPGGTSIHVDMSGDDYENYCLSLETLVEPLGRRDGADVERWLFSEPNSEWRKYLKTLDWNRKLDRK